MPSVSNTLQLPDGTKVAGAAVTIELFPSGEYWSTAATGTAVVGITNTTTDVTGTWTKTLLSNDLLAPLGSTYRIVETVASGNEVFEHFIHVPAGAGPYNMFDILATSPNPIVPAGAIPYTVFVAKGDLLVGTGAGTATRIPVGSNGQVPVADSADSEGISWQSVSGAVSLATALPPVINFGSAISILGSSSKAAKEDHNHGGQLQGVAGATLTALTGDLTSATFPLVVPVGQAPFACTLTNVRGYRSGGTGVAVNFSKGSVTTPANKGLASDLSVSSNETWMDGGTVQNVAYASGDPMFIILQSVTGAVKQVSIYAILTSP